MVKGVSKEDKRAFINEVKSYLCKNASKFLQLRNYNDSKRMIRNIDRQNCGRLVDNGHHFMHIMQEAANGCGDSRVSQKWDALKAQNRSEKGAKKQAMQQRNHQQSQQSRPQPQQVSSQQQRYSAYDAVVGVSSRTNPPHHNNVQAAVPIPEWEKREGKMIGVYYCRTDDTPGDKEYTCVVLEAIQTVDGRLPAITYSGTIYDYHMYNLREEKIPLSYNHRVKFEVPMNRLDSLREKAGTTSERLPVHTWIEGPLKEQVLQYWKDNETKNSLVPSQEDNRGNALEWEARGEKMIGVYYCLTDDTPGDREYSCVVLEVLQTADGSLPTITPPYSGTLYNYHSYNLKQEQIPLKYNYRVKFEVPMNRLDGLREKAGTTSERLPVHAWIEGALKEQVLQYWKDNETNTSIKMTICPLNGYAGFVC